MFLLVIKLNNFSFYLSIVYLCVLFYYYDVGNSIWKSLVGCVFVYLYFILFFIRDFLRSLVKSIKMCAQLFDNFKPSNKQQRNSMSSYMKRRKKKHTRKERREKKRKIITMNIKESTIKIKGNLIKTKIK